MSCVSIKIGQFDYFDHQLDQPDWQDSTVLDFGGNAGNILLDPLCMIDTKKYWCVDLNENAIVQGRQRHPDAHFVRYDRYNFEYNPTGAPDAPIPDLGRRFDIIIAYSVFTHASKTEMRQLVKQLRSMVADDGVLAFTFIDPYFQPPDGWVDEDRYYETPGLDNLSWRLTLSLGPGRATALAAAARRRGPLTWATFVNHEEFIVGSSDDWIAGGGERSQYLTFCTEQHMRSIYPDAEILPPVEPERQSCCVLGT